LQRNVKCATNLFKSCCHAFKDATLHFILDELSNLLFHGFSWFGTFKTMVFCSQTERTTVERDFYIGIDQMPNSPNSPRTAAARRRAAISIATRRAYAARVIQARVRGMLTRLHLANPAWGRTYANVVAGRRGLGYRAVQRRVFNRPNNMRAYGASIRAGIRHGPEHYVTGKVNRHWRQTYLAMGPKAWKGMVKGINGPRGSISRRTPSPNRNNNNNLYR